jgi:hypothetical protein
MPSQYSAGTNQKLLFVSVINEVATCFLGNCKGSEAPRGVIACFLGSGKDLQVLDKAISCDMDFSHNAHPAMQILPKPSMGLSKPL